MSDELSGLRATDPIGDRLDRVKEDQSIDMMGMSIPIKNAVIMAAFTIVGGGAGVVWTASELYGRLTSVEQAVEGIPDLSPVEERVSLLEQTVVELGSGKFDLRIERIETRIEDQNLSDLQGTLRELQTRMETILEQQKSLSDFAEDTVEYRRAVDKVKQDMATFRQDMDDIWTALDEVTY
jgi:soluble cytochrome b562